MDIVRTHKMTKDDAAGWIARHIDELVAKLRGVPCYRGKVGDVLSFTVQYSTSHIEGLVRITDSQYVFSLMPSDELRFDPGEERIRLDVEQWLDENVPE